MDEKPKTYWMSPEQKRANGLVQIGGDEFPGLEAAGGTRLKRRDFLKVAGFSFAAAGITGCTRAPVEKAIPLLIAPEEIVPGVAQYYASTCGGCAAGCGTLIKVRDGRPIKLEGNPQHALSRGGLCAVGQASLLGLYDTQRFRAPEKSGKPIGWKTLDAEIVAKLAELRSSRGVMRIVTPTLVSPTLRAAISNFVKQYPGAKHVVYDVPSRSAILDAHERTHGARVLPRYDFGRAEVVLSFGADFLSTWISPVEFTEAYTALRRPTPERPRMSYHVQFESRMSLTGGNADRRYAIAPGDAGAILTYLAARIANRAAVGFDAGSNLDLAVDRTVLDKLADRLWSMRGKSLVVSGSNDLPEHLLVNLINHLLGNYGTTLDVERPSQQAQGSDADTVELLDEITAGKVQALVVLGANPAFDFPRHAEAIAKIPLLITLAERRDETAALAHYVAPDHHSLESWGDAEPSAGRVSLQQPAIRPLADTRSAPESLARWTGREGLAYDLLRDAWRNTIYRRAQTKQSFDAFWDRSLHDGYVEVDAESPQLKAFDATAARPIARASSPYAVVLHTTAAMFGGRHAYNPWLHELPDPITKVTWDNHASLSPATAAKLGVAEGDVVAIETGSGTIQLPAFVQPGQHDGAIAVALGYGSKLSARFAKIGPQWIDAVPSVDENGCVGRNAAGLIAVRDRRLGYISAATIKKTGKHQLLATTQTHNTLTVPEKLAKFEREPRPIIQETTLAAFAKNPAAGVQESDENRDDLWPSDHETTGPRWGMVIDLAACTGCSGCVIACQAENNVSVVGKDEVRRNREMHWLRIDRYYSESESGTDVAFQPLLCQQCGNAPCETVCPVLATVHSEDGLNQQIYNRCVGTRYCANNCPYKGRRFNWFDYAHDDVLQNLVLNPDVTVRSRGVMEKCSFCVQRIQLAKIAARDEGRAVADGEIKTACQQSCPADAIVFGDLNDPKSRVAQLMRNPRRYRVLSELGVKPAVGFLTLVRNREEGEENRG